LNEKLATISDEKIINKDIQDFQDNFRFP